MNRQTIHREKGKVEFKESWRILQDFEQKCAGSRGRQKLSREGGETKRKQGVRGLDFSWLIVLRNGVFGNDTQQSLPAASSGERVETFHETLRARLVRSERMKT
ncbi:uncharacterized protein LOC143350240 isoform X2 [Colletes latitarsis]|uniref:uncharacterized protein LOC143350240 isoform X2 n=1 Tax=Colletes latitarsis TaxID=2605962 RepID=UPI0040370C37